MIRVRYTWLIGLWFVLVPCAGTSQERFYARSDAREVLTNSYFQVEFVLENGSGTDFSPPDFSPLQVVSGPSTSSQISIINGRRSQKKTYGYTLLASREGTYTIGPASIRVSRKTIQTDPLEIRVVAGRTESAVRQAGEEVFVRAEVSDTVVYPGQRILLNYVLYTTKRVTGYNYLSNPTYEGFYTQEMNPRDQVERRVIDGVEYQVQSFQTIALFPQQLGDLSLVPVQFSLSIPQRNDPFSLFNQNRQVPVVTNENRIRVIPLPEGSPPSFNGAVGQFNMTAVLNSRQATTDDAISLKVTIEGNGLARFIEAPAVDLDDRFDVYDPKVVDESVYATQDDIVSKKTFEYLLVPKKEGRQEFQVEFSYFDTDSSRYETLYSPEFSVLIRPGQNSLAGLSSEEILEKYQLRPMMMDTKIGKERDYFISSVWFAILVAVLLLSMPGMLLYRYLLIRRGRIDPAERRKKRARKEANKRLAKARDLLETRDFQGFYRAISEALERYIADKFAIHTVELSKENIISRLAERQVPAGSIEEYLAIQVKCDRALFGGEAAEASREIYDRAEQLLRQMLLDLEKL
jgi:hypothetical protein